MAEACPPSPRTTQEQPIKQAPIADQRLVRHPRGLHVLCIVVFFERWAAYLLGSSTVLMLCERYGFSRADALRWVGVFGASTYLLTVAGGFMIERWLSSRRALAAGIGLLALGYAAMVLPGAEGLRVAVTLLLFGHALFKPSTQTVMAGLYNPTDPRLDTAQIRFYLAVNIGGTVGAMTAGLLVRGHDFPVLCATAAAAMFAGQVALAAGCSTLNRRSQADRQPIPVPVCGANPEGHRYNQRRHRTLAGLLLAMLLYTTCFGQVEGSLFLWAQDRTDRMLLGFEIPAAWFVGMPAFLVVLLAPVQLWLTPRFTGRIHTEWMIAAGVLALVAAFAVLLPPALLANGQHVSMAWLCACMTLLVLGELLIAPLSLSLLLRLVPQRWVGLLVALWYSAGAAGYWLAGEIGAWFMNATMS